MSEQLRKRGPNYENRRLAPTTQNQYRLSAERILEEAVYKAQESQRSEKQLSAAMRAWLADWFYEHSEPNVSTSQPLNSSTSV